MRRTIDLIAGLYALLIYAFIFLPVAMLVLFSFQATLFPIPPFNGPSLRWYQTVLSDPRLMGALANSLTVALPRSLIQATMRRRRSSPNSLGGAVFLRVGTFVIVRSYPGVRSGREERTRA